MRLLRELQKNFKLLFRNWTTLALLVLGPLLLILLVGYAFSGTDVHDIRIGVVSNDVNQIESILANVSSIGEVVTYPSIVDCSLDLENSELHLCLDVRVEEIEPFSGDVTFYFDPTRKKITLLVLDQVKAFFGLKAEEISILSAQTLLGEVQELVNFIEENRGDLDAIQDESRSIRMDLIERKAQLQAINDSFTPTYRRVRSSYDTARPHVDTLVNLSDQVGGQAAGIQQQIGVIVGYTSQVNNLTAQLDSAYDKINETIPGLLPDTFTSDYLNATEQLEDELLRINQTIGNVTNTTNTTAAVLVQTTQEIDDLIAQLDTIQQLLEFEIVQTDRYIELIDKSNIRIQELSDAIDERIGSLEQLDPTLAETLIKPITQGFQSIIDDPPSVQNIFPVLLSTMILFISLLFANIVSLLEIYNKAYIRNILAPVNSLLFMSGLIISNFLVVFFQVIVLLIVAQIQFGVDIIGHIGSLLVISVTLIGIFVFLGMIIANITKTVQSSILLTTFTALVFFLFSDVVTSLEAMPIPASIAAGLNPIVLSNEMIRRVLFFGHGIGDLIQPFAILLIYLVGLFFVLTYVTQKKNMGRF